MPIHVFGSSTNHGVSRHREPPASWITSSLDEAAITVATHSYTSNTELMLERKDQMRRRGVPSPDEWDAVALTFAEPVVMHRPRPLDYSQLDRQIV